MLNIKKPFQNEVVSFYSKEEIPFELDILKQAYRYQNWIVDKIIPFMGKNIFEFGAGIGSISRWIISKHSTLETMYLSEISPQVLEKLLSESVTWNNREKIKSITPTDIFDSEKMLLIIEKDIDTIVSFNVLEHIKEDTLAIAALTDLLLLARKQKGDQRPRRIITVVPAHNWASGAVDKIAGHHRRYDKKMCKNILNFKNRGKLVYSRYFNIFGILGWLFFGKFLNKERIDQKTVATFEALLPFLKPIDWILCSFLRIPFGQSIIFIIEV